MANAIVYVDSGAGGANNGTSWANAYTTLEAAITASGTTGTDFYIKSTHTEGKGSALTLTFKGAAATPDRVFSCGTTNSPPTTADLAVGALINTTSGTSGFAGNVYIYGCTFQSTNSNVIINHNGGVSSGDATLDNCKIIIPNAVVIIGVGSATGVSRTTLINTTMKFGGTGANIQPRGGLIRWLNTPSAIDVTGSLPTTLFAATSANFAPIVILDGVDLSALASKTLLGAYTAMITMQFVNCAMPSGYLIATPTGQIPLVDVVNSDSAATGYNQARYTYQGTLLTSTSVYNGASDGTTPISWQVVTTANACPQSPFECFEIVQWVAAGTYAASKIYATSATGSLKTNDVWVDVEYLGASYPQASPATTLGAGSGSANTPQIPQGTTPGNITTGASWANGGLGTNYSLDIPSFTTSAAGYVRFRIKVGKPSLTINIDPLALVA